MEFSAVILAAGKGTRMRSSLPKPLHQLGGRPMLDWVIASADAAGAEKMVAVVDNLEGKLAKTLEGAAYGNLQLALQEEPRGTGDAVACARQAVGEKDEIILIAFADTPLIRPETWQRLAAALNAPDVAIACLGFRPADPTGYGRLIQDRDGTLLRITEEMQANSEEKAIGFVNSGIMAVRSPLIFRLLEDAGHDNPKGEKLLTDCIAIARANGYRAICQEAEEEETVGINSRLELAQAEGLLQDRFRHAAMLGGVSLTDPGSVFLCHDTLLENDVTIHPHVVIGPGVRIGKGSVIHSFSHLEGVEIGPGCSIGPQARLRPGTQLGAAVKIGNFVETKNARMEDGAKVNHLSYIGDASIGSDANIGAGTITCNYDGSNKHHTSIGSEAFIGSNSALVAPLSIGARAIIGAGSTISVDVPADALALSRAEQTVLEGRGSAIRDRNKKAKERQT